MMDKIRWWIDDHLELMMVGVVVVVVVGLIGWVVYDGIARINGIQEGEIVKLEVQPAHIFTFYTPITSCSGSDSSRICTTINIPSTVYDDQDFVVYVSAYDVEDDDIQSNYFYVTEQRFDSLELGDWFVYSKELDKAIDVHEDVD